MAKEHLLGLMVHLIKVKLNIIKETMIKELRKNLGFFIIRVEEFMKENGRMVYNKEAELSNKEIQ